MFRLKFLLSCMLFATATIGKAIPNKAWNVAPPHWYIGFSDSVLEIVVNASEISAANVYMKDYEGVEYLGKKPSANRHIAYLQVKISKNAKPGFLEFYSKVQSSWNRIRGGRTFRLKYELKNRKTNKRIAFKKEGVLYNLIVDRFSNGTKKNDAKGAFNTINRSLPHSNHGGDFEGLLNHVNYLANLGVTGIGLNAVQANGESNTSYLGLNITNHYRIYSPLGTENELALFISKANKNGMAVLMDMLPNYFDTKHWMHTYFDTGWFLNQSKNAELAFPQPNTSNAHMAKYMDQVALWWSEYMALSGYTFRMSNPSQLAYFNHLSEVLGINCPGLKLLLDVDANSPLKQACSAANNIFQFKQNHLSSVTDYQLCKATLNGFGNPINIGSVFEILEYDLLYANPSELITLSDYSKGKRLFSQMDGNIDRWKAAMVLLFTTRGTPRITYGTEFGLDGSSDNFYPDMPGGWQGDAVNMLEKAKRPKFAAEAFNFTQKLTRMRTLNPALSNGRTILGYGSNLIQVYFRIGDSSRYMVVLNLNKKETKLNLNSYPDYISAQNSLTDLLSGKETFLSDQNSLDATEVNTKTPFDLILEPHTSYVYKIN